MAALNSTWRIGRWVAALSGVAVAAAVTIAWIGADDSVSPAAGLFHFRRDRDKDKESKQKEAEQEAKLALPPGVPIAPPAVSMAPVDLPDAPDDPVLRRVDEAIRITRRRFLNAEDIGASKQHTPWQIMHGILAIRQDLELKTNHGLVNAIDWVSQDPVFHGEHWFEATRFGGRGHPFNVPYYFEGHVNQFLALLTMANLPLDHKIGVAGGRTVSMSDMVRHAQMTVNANEEISWTLWFLTHYIEPDASWVNAQGQRWSMETLVRLQTVDDVTTAPCGGTHGLFALSYARNSYAQKFDGRLTGAWLEADQKIQNSLASARAMQNRDGSFSTHFFKETGYSTDATERLKGSGHMLEWMMMAARQPQLSEQWLRAGVYSVANDLIRFSNQPIDPGPLYHSLHAIVLYRDRVTPRSLEPVDARPLAAQPAQPNRQGSEPEPKQLPPQSATEQPAPEAGVAKVSPGPASSAPVKPNEPANSPAGRSLITLEITPVEPGVGAPVKPESQEPKPPTAASVAIDQHNTRSDSQAVPPKTASSGDPLPALPVLAAPPKDMPMTTLGPGHSNSSARAATPPKPDDRPIAASVAPDPPKPPSVRIVHRSTDGLEKPRGSAASAPPVPVVTQPTPIVLPPLPLDPVDLPVGAR